MHTFYLISFISCASFLDKIVLLLGSEDICPWGTNVNTGVVTLGESMQGGVKPPMRLSNISLLMLRTHQVFSAPTKRPSRRRTAGGVPSGEAPTAGGRWLKGKDEAAMAGRRKARPKAWESVESKW